MNTQKEMEMIADLFGFTIKTIILVILIPLWWPILVIKRFKEAKEW